MSDISKEQANMFDQDIEYFVTKVELAEKNLGNSIRQLVTILRAEITASRSREEELQKELRLLTMKVQSLGETGIASFRG